jgi:uncharacterized protein (TIGR04141 family)
VKEEHQSLQIQGVGGFFLQESFVSTPDSVLDFFGQELAGKFKIHTASAKGVLLVPIEHEGETRIFAVTFDYGRYILNDGVVEERFGLKVVLNTVVRDSLRSIDEATLGSVQKQSREQMSREGEAVSSTPRPRLAKVFSF